MRRPEGVRAQPPFVAILSVRSDLRRSERVSWAVFRYLPSAVTSDDVSVISGELARLALAWAGSRRRRARARPPCVAISSPPGDLRRSERVSWAVFRYLTSAVTSDDVSVISGELARLSRTGRARSRPRAPPHATSQRTRMAQKWYAFRNIKHKEATKPHESHGTTAGGVVRGLRGVG